MTLAPAGAQRLGRDDSAKRRLVELVFGFACVFGGLMLPRRGLGVPLSALFAHVGNWLLPDTLDSGVKLAFRASPDPTSDPWQLPLSVTPLPPQPPISIPIDVRALVFVPLACFVALAVATPLGGWRKNARLLGTGLLVLTPLVTLLTALPVLSFLGGLGPVRAFELGRTTHVVLQIVYRALVAPPGMAFALPLFLWWVLLKISSRAKAAATGASAEGATK